MQIGSDFARQLLSCLKADEALSGVAVHMEWEGPAFAAPLKSPALTVGLSALRPQRDIIGDYRGLLAGGEALHASLWRAEAAVTLYEPAGESPPGTGLLARAAAALMRAGVVPQNLKTGERRFDKATGALVRTIQAQAFLLLSPGPED